MNKSLADLAHDIISLANENNSKAEELMQLLYKFNDGNIPHQLRMIISTIEAMDSDSLMSEMRLIFSRLSRRRTELKGLGNIVSSLPNRIQEVKS